VVSADAWTRPSEFVSGASVGTREILIAGGSTYAGTIWVLAVTDPITVDSGAQPWRLLSITSAQISGPVAYVSQPNTFTAQQTISHNQQAYGLLIDKTSDTADALTLNYAGNGLGMTMTTDWSANLTGTNTWDSVDIIHRSNGDGIFVCHVGGIPPGYVGTPPGANAALNVLVPYWLDDLSQGSGTVVNTRNGQSGLLISSIAANSGVYGINVLHGGGQAAVQVTNQKADPTRNPVVGGGPAVVLDDYSSTYSLGIVRHAVPVAGAAAIQVFPAPGVGAFPAVAGSTDGATAGFQIQTDGRAQFGMRGTPPAAKVAIVKPADAVAHLLSLSNPSVAPGAGHNLTFDGPGGATYAGVNTYMDSGIGNGQLALNVLQANVLNTFVNLNGAAPGGITLLKPTIVASSAPGTSFAVAARPGSQGFYAASVAGQDFGPYVTTVLNGGRTLTLVKNGTGAGTVIQVQNKGTGASLDIQIGNSPVSAFQILSNGQVKFALPGNEATGTGSASLGGNSPATRLAAPYTWEKVTTSDGSQGFIPVWR
jgi:hypothetical protein